MRQGLNLEVDNRTPYLIRDCRIYFQNAVFDIGDIIPDEKQKKRITQVELIEAGICREGHRETVLFEQWHAACYIGRRSAFPSRSCHH